MRYDELKDLNIRKGTIHSIRFKRVVKTLKSFNGGVVEKETVGTYRFGINYANIRQNQAKVVGSLPYGQWTDDQFLIEQIINGNVNYQLRLTTTGNPNHKAHTKWYLNGAEIDKQDLINMNALGSADRNPRPMDPNNPIQIFNVKLENVIEIH